MNDFIHNQKTDTSTQSNEAFYCLKGQEDFIDKDNYPRCDNIDNKNVCAKKVSRVDGTIKYMIKTGDDRKLYNPDSIYGNTEHQKLLRSISRNQNSFKEVNYTAFYLYLRFLKTKNIAYLHNAEREI